MIFGYVSETRSLSTHISYTYNHRSALVSEIFPKNCCHTRRRETLRVSHEKSKLNLFVGSVLIIKFELIVLNSNNT